MDRKLDINSDKQRHTRKYYRIFKIVTCVLSIFLLIAIVTTYFQFTSESWNEFPCNFNLSVLLLKPEYFPDGSIVDNGLNYPLGQYFSVNDTIRGCVCAIEPCIRKCCNDGELYIKVPGKLAYCQTNPSFNPFNSTIPVYNDSLQLITDVSPGHFRVFYGNVCPKGKYPADPGEAFLMANGSIIKNDNDTHSMTLIDASQYCLESVNGSEHVIRTYFCFDPDNVEEQVMFKLYPIGMMISIPFMVITFVVYGVVSELRNLHGKSLMSQTISLCTAYICLVIIQVFINVSDFWCIFLAFTVQFTFLASFFWMNVMCFDIWWVFSGLRAPRGSAKERDHKKFLMYSVYAWGVAAIIVAISLVMDLAPFIPNSFIKPGFGDVKCWFKDKAGTLLYFYLPISVVILLNIAMFVSTACKLRTHSKETKVLHSSESRQNSKVDKDRFDLYLKLFVVMGINWVLEIVSFFGGGPKSLWFVTDIGNTLQGVLIFLIFVCKRRVLRLVNQKLCPRWNLMSAFTSSQSHTGSTLTHSTLMSRTTSDNPSNTPQSN